MAKQRVRVRVRVCSCGAIYRMMKMFFCRGFASGRRLRIPASGYESRNEKVNLTVEERRGDFVSISGGKKKNKRVKAPPSKGKDTLTFVWRSRKLRRQRLESYRKLASALKPPK